MHPLLPAQPPRTVLLIGAHCDDIEIGCGGTLLRAATAWPQARFHWLTLSSDAQREAESRAAAERLLAGAAQLTLEFASFRQSYFPHEAATIKDRFEDLKRRCTPDLVFTHCRGDAHQDHRVANELAWNTFRDHLILEYEIPKFDGDLGQPTVFVPLSRAELDTKCSVLMDCFASQHTRGWFTRSTFEGLARLRGIECNAPEGYAEAFYARKVCLLV
jgi:LmbE family N-acetylglucosaminyl deacetylase